MIIYVFLGETICNMDTAKVRITLDLSIDEHELAKKIAIRRNKSISEILRRMIHMAHEIDTDKVFVSTSPNCSDQIPKSMLI